MQFDAHGVPVHQSYCAGLTARVPLIASPIFGANVRCFQVICETEVPLQFQQRGVHGVVPAIKTMGPLPALTVKCGST